MSERLRITPAGREVVEARRERDAVLRQAAELRQRQDAVLALHRPWYEVNGVRHDHALPVPWDEAPKGHVCRIGGWDSCSRENEEHYVLACMECRGATDEGEVGYLFWPCPTVRILAPEAKP